VDGTQPRATAAALLAILDAADTPPTERVHAVVGVLDLAIVTEPDDPVLEQLLARCVVAVGHPLAGHTRAPTVAATLAAAEAFVRGPGAGTRAHYVACATRSYPYGPGDGCYAVRDRPCPAPPGNGCRSGAGTLAQVAYAVGADVVAGALTADVAPWLRTLAA
jgi:hypothetical protein